MIQYFSAFLVLIILTLMGIAIFKKSKLKRWQFEIEVIGLGLALISIIVSYELSKQESLERYKQLEPAVLNVTHWVDISDPQDKSLFINITNMAKYKSTGSISIYKTEVNPHKPAMILSSLGPGENKTNIRLGINYTEMPFPIKTDIRWFGFNLTPPCKKIYYLNEYAVSSISYRVTCDNCKSEGVVGSIPDFGECGSLLEIDPKEIYENKTVTGKLPIYSWVHVTLEDLKEK